MSIHNYVGTPDNEVSIRVETVEDLAKGIDELHTLALNNLEEGETCDAVLEILSDAIERLEAQV